MRSDWLITINDGFCECEYVVEISNKESIESVIAKIRKLFKEDEKNEKIRKEL